jgi:hypothetical protein
MRYRVDYEDGAWVNFKVSPSEHQNGHRHENPEPRAMGVVFTDHGRFYLHRLDLPKISRKMISISKSWNELTAPHNLRWI